MSKKDFYLYIIKNIEKGNSILISNLKFQFYNFYFQMKI